MYSRSGYFSHTLVSRDRNHPLAIILYNLCRLTGIRGLRKTIILVQGKDLDFFERANADLAEWSKASGLFSSHADFSNAD